MLYGVWNRVACVDLTDGRIHVTSLDEGDWFKYVGGSALGTKILSDHNNGKALDPDIPVIFATGPFQGSRISGSAKWALVSKSPLTGTFAVTTAGASWGDRLKKAGFDVLVVKGRAPKPVYIEVTDNKIVLCEAKHLWGTDTVECCSILGGKEVSVATIGPAGENLIGASCVVADGHSFAGRCGIGAVMGSKNLKAVTVTGHKTVPVRDVKGLEAFRSRIAAKLLEATKDTFRAHGTAGTLASCEAIGDLPIKYWTGDTWPNGASAISAPRFTEYHNAKPWPCRNCVVACHRRITYPFEGAGAEYESLAMLGSNCLIDDLDCIAEANDLCNRLGLDTISAGSYAGFLMECYENGLLGKWMLDEMPEWGNGDFLIQFIRDLALRQGIGGLFSAGIVPAAKALDAEDLAVHVKNLDFPAHDPRTYFSLAVNYATSTRGACHLRGFSHCGEAGLVPMPEIGFLEPPNRFSMEGQAKLAILMQDYATVLDSLVCCCFMQLNGITLEETAQTLDFLTGWGLSPNDLLKVGERAFNLQRLVNISDGITSQDDRLPKKMFIPAKEGFRKGRIPEPFSETINEYYVLRGWDEQGRPRESTLKALGL